MFKKIAMKTVDGPQEYGFEANGTTKIRYKQLFHEDLNKALDRLEPDSADYDTDVIDQLAFVMNMQAEKKDMASLTTEDYIAWLEHLEGGATRWISTEIINTYIGNTKTTSKKKNQEGPQPEK